MRAKLPSLLLRVPADSVDQLRMQINTTSNEYGDYFRLHNEIICCPNLSPRGGVQRGAGGKHVAGKAINGLLLRPPDPIRGRYIKDVRGSITGGDAISERRQIENENTENGRATCPAATGACGGRREMALTFRSD
ncbi:hypothetical protein EVAR_86780_1 [Eumeta japonica]|uniref:Uncharacterized protein n=1 Tax=Eumeta variegata TaxID=151549 RepID=A0A4C1VZ64_EUMVA|nr:hypothetical protein EVAR_86780_1 [Eumeta japonica]